ncbi:MAG: L-threonylcarbamoyladenylate synthase, partial [Eikenella corrodens]
MMFPRILSAAAARGLRAHLRGGGLVAYPTESSYGLGCLPTHRRALHRLMQLKKRPQHKGLIVIGNLLKQLEPLLQRLP